MTKEQSLAKAINTRVHRLEGEETDWREKWNILIISGDKESLEHVVFTAIDEYASDIQTRYKQLLETFAELIAAYDTPGPVRDQAVKKAKWILAYEDENSKDYLGDLMDGKTDVL